MKSSLIKWTISFICLASTSSAMAWDAPSLGGFLPWSKKEAKSDYKYVEPKWESVSGYRDPYPNGIPEYEQISKDKWQRYLTGKLGCNPNNRPKNFKFCAESKEINMANAFWLSCLSKNSYEHYDATYMDLKLNLGFGSDAAEDDIVEKYILKYGSYFTKLRKLAESGNKDAEESLEWIRMGREKRELQKSAPPARFYKDNAYITFLVDELVHFSNTQERIDRGEGRLKRSKSPIDFVSTLSTGQSVLDKEDLINVMANGGFGFLKIFLKKSQKELDVEYDSARIGGTQITWAEHKDFAVVAVRGTQPPIDTKDANIINDTITDAVAFQTMFDYKQKFGEKKRYTAMIHLGFNAAFAEAHKFVLSKITSLQKKAFDSGTLPKPVFITGHSLGGALATVLASRLMGDNFENYIDLDPKSVDGKPAALQFASRIKDSYSQDVKGYVDPNKFCKEMLPADQTREKILQKIQNGERVKFNNIKGLYTYGSPRVGDGTFKLMVECFAKRTGTVIARFRNNEDLVPAVPHYNESAVLPYVHIGSEVILGSENDDGYRVPHLEVSESQSFPGSRVPGIEVRPIQEYYQNYATDNYLQSFTKEEFLNSCEPGTKCGAHGSPYYLARRDSHPSKMTNNLIRTGLKLGIKKLLGEADFLSTLADHTMGAEGGSGYSDTGETYAENLYRLMPEDGNVNCDSYDVKDVPFTKVDVVFSDKLRAETFEAIKKSLIQSKSTTRYERDRGRISEAKKARFQETDELIKDLESTIGSVRNQLEVTVGRKPRLRSQQDAETKKVKLPSFSGMNSL